MSSVAKTASGSMLYVSIASPATRDQAGYEALTWTKVGNVVSGGDLGGTINTATYDPLDGGPTQSLPGNMTVNELTAQLAYTSSDAGQALLSSLVTIGDANYQECVSTKFVLSTGETFYNEGFCTQYQPTPSGANDMVSAAATFVQNYGYTVV